MEPCPNLSLPPFGLPTKALGEVHLVPESCSSSEFSTYLSNSKKLTSLENFTVIATESHPGVQGLKIFLQSSSSGNSEWYNLLKAKLKKFVDEKSDFLLIENLQEKIRFHLLQYGKVPEKLFAKEITLWLIPVAKVHLPEGSKTPVPGEENGKKVVKKKIIKKVVKKKPANSTSIENSPTPEPKKKSSASSNEIENGINGLKTSKESSPVVVEQVVEDVSSVSYLVKMGLSPAEDGVSLKDEHEKPTNGVSNGHGPLDDKLGLLKDKLNNIGDKGSQEEKPKSEEKQGSPETRWATPESSEERRGSRELPPSGFTLNTAKRFDDTVNGIKPEESKTENGFKSDENGSEDKSILSSVSETISSMSSDGANASFYFMEKFNVFISGYLG